MPSKKKRGGKKGNARVPAKLCDICCDTLIAAHDVGVAPDNTIYCENSHELCVACARKLVEPTELCSYTCSGLMFRCPTCRTNACLRPTHVLALLRGSHKTACSMIAQLYDTEDNFDTRRVLIDGDVFPVPADWEATEGVTEVTAAVAAAQLTE